MCAWFDNSSSIAKKNSVESSVKWSDLGHFFGAQDKFFLSFQCTLFFTYF